MEAGPDRTQRELDTADNLRRGRYVLMDLATDKLRNALPDEGKALQWSGVQSSRACNPCKVFPAIVRATRRLRNALSFRLERLEP